METVHSIYFYKVTENFGYMSNFYPCTFTDGTTTYNCSEQYLMAHKCKLFDPDNSELLNKILNETKPMEIKEYGRMVKNFNQTIWDEHKFNIMVNGLTLKFNQNSDIKEQLKATAPKTLYEAAKNDKIWGIGYSAKEVLSATKTLTFGENLLGLALMKVRESL